MRIRQIAPHDLQADLLRPDQPWLLALCLRLRDLPQHPYGRVLIAEEDGQLRALLGMRLRWGDNGRLKRATICVLGIDPDHNRRGIGSRLVRFAEGIARINGCARVDVAPDVEEWEDGRCWTGLGYDGTDAGLQKVLGSPIGRTSA
jgi:ribosomal protein S18 acetylase RimI-like enzyme